VLSQIEKTALYIFYSHNGTPPVWRDQNDFPGMVSTLADALSRYFEHTSQQKLIAFTQLFTISRPTFNILNDTTLSKSKLPVI